MKKTNISSESSGPIITDAEEGDKESQFVDAAPEPSAEVSSVAEETNPSQSDSGQGTNLGQEIWYKEKWYLILVGLLPQMIALL